MADLRRGDVVVATGNAHKLAEIEEILGRVMPGRRFVGLRELGDWSDPEEDGETFLDNALIKARAAIERCGCELAVADDSGLMVDALDGAPGVLSARFAGSHGDDEANNARLLAELEGVPAASRGARFCSCVVLARADGSYLEGTGFCEGSVGLAPRGDNGFGYDPLFWPDDTPGRTMAELSPEEKNAISHRFHALAALAGQLADS